MKKKSRVCRKCGTEVEPKIKICPNCGAKVKPPLYKRWWIYLLAAAAVICIAAVVCLLAAPTDHSLIKHSEVSDMYASPDNYVGRTFDFTAKVLDVDQDSDTTTIQAFYDIENLDKNTVIYSDKKINVKEDEYIKVHGEISGELSGENALGGDITAPEVQAASVKVITEAEAYPAVKTVKINKTITKSGLKVHMSKIDFTDREMRIYLKATNTAGSTMSIYADQGVVIQSGKQFETSYDHDYPEVSSDIKPGASSSGIIAYSKVKQQNFKVTFDGCDADYNDLSFTFNIAVD